MQATNPTATPDEAVTIDQTQAIQYLRQKYNLRASRASLNRAEADGALEVYRPLPRRPLYTRESLDRFALRKASGKKPATKTRSPR